MRRIEYRGVAWDIKDVDTGGPGDWPFWDRWEQGDFEPETVEVIDRFVTSGSTFVDIGAWVGPMSMWAASKGARVISVEPDPVAAQYLRKHVAANYPDQITVFEGALNDTTGTCHIEAHEFGWASCMTHLSDEGYEVPCITLPDLFTAHNIQDCSLVKIDIEGGESVVLEHVAPFLAEIGVPLVVAMHGHIALNGRHNDYSWFDNFDSYSFLEEEASDGWYTVLALPK